MFETQKFRLNQPVLANPAELARWVAALGVLAFGAAAIVLWGMGGFGGSEPVENLIPMATTAPSPEVSPQPVGFATELAEPIVEPDQPAMVHVVGEVMSPGLIELDSGGRIFDAVEKAGGLTTAADVTELNLAALVRDGMQIEVPTAGEKVARPLVRSDVHRSSNSGSAISGSGPVSINSASETELQQLPGVGPATAAAIVARRDKVGPFESVDELTTVRGIGQAKLDALREVATV